MKKNEVFTTVNLPISGEATVLEGKGIHYFSALSKAKGDSSLVVKYLIIEVVQVDGKHLSEQQLDEMHIRDISYLSTIISMMMSDDFLQGIS